MKFLKRITAALAVAALALAPIASAQVNVNGIQVLPFKAKYVSHAVTAADTDQALLIKYFGAGGTSTTTVAVEADSNLTFVVNGAAYAGFECPVSGDLGGVIDVSDAACNTLGEVVDVINATATSFSTGYFRATILAGLRSDSSNAVLLADAADTEVTTPLGEVVFHDSSTTDDTVIGLWPREEVGKSLFLPQGGSRVPVNTFANSDSVLQYYHENITNAGTVGNIEVYCVKENYLDAKSVSSETATLIYTEAGAATTVTGLINEFNYAGGGLHCQGGKIVVKLLASGADTSALTVFGTGFLAPAQP